MGYCACRRPCRCRSESAPVSPILLILLVVAILMTLPWLFSYPSVIEVETPKFQINWALIIAPLLLLFMVHCLSSVEPRRKPCPMPPPPPPIWGCPCRGKHACVCARFKYPAAT